MTDKIKIEFEVDKDRIIQATEKELARILYDNLGLSQKILTEISVTQSIRTAIKSLVSEILKERKDNIRQKVISLINDDEFIRSCVIDAIKEEICDRLKLTFDEVDEE